MADMIRNSDDTVGVVPSQVTGYRILNNVPEGVAFSLLLDSVAPELKFETAADIEALTPKVSAFLTAFEAI